MKDTLLIELLTEELPPKSLMRLGMAFHEQMQKSLADAGFISADNQGRWYATPRRLALQFDDCLSRQPDRIVEKKGPSVAAVVGADGTASKALQGFMRSAGVEFAQLEKTHDGKAEYFVARIQQRGEPIEHTLAARVETALKKLPIAKLMRWGDSEVQFVRPVHGLVLMHGARLLDGVVLGVASRSATLGHRFMSFGIIAIPHARDYETLLETRGRVVPNFARRRAMIHSQLDQAAGTLRWLPDDALLDEVTALVEFPAVYEASFDEAFLSVPQECLILTMKANQKYFPLMDGNSLTHRFLVVSNMQVSDPTHIVTGNARVVRPRLADAKFFFETDKKTPLIKRLDKLDRVIYHNKLGTQGDRVKRMTQLAGKLAQRLGCNVAHAERAAQLAKADLVSDMVGEFPELQGIMGRYYALHDGEPAVVADAIQAHYQPRFNGDSLPGTPVACCVALAEKLDALVGFFGIGQIPTGDKDPFGLRRAALGVLRMLMEIPLALDLDDLLNDTAAVYAPGVLGGEWQAQLREFMQERLRNLLRSDRNDDCANGYDISMIDAVLALHPTRIDQIPAKLAAVKSFGALPEALALAAANKRIVNILKKNGIIEAVIQPEQLVEAAEKELAQRIDAIEPEVEAKLNDADYTAALKALAGLRAPVDAFFDNVMVMSEDAGLRTNRLALLSCLARLLNCVADISRLTALAPQETAR
ncbi:MAG TPA: glycine--tRNA ligase subunit beta [Rhodocyclaceae bacterium]|nr:glycine--tRNA ligase subunit beta [Rhodocyclaceae bacterium]